MARTAWRSPGSNSTTDPWAQGVAPRSQLLRQFRETPHAVLFATASFWQGVDVAGDALERELLGDPRVDGDHEAAVRLRLEALASP